MQKISTVFQVLFLLVGTQLEKIKGKIYGTRRKNKKIKIEAKEKTNWGRARKIT
jgi:hypothetical protein